MLPFSIINCSVTYYFIISQGIWVRITCGKDWRWCFTNLSVWSYETRCMWSIVHSMRSICVFSSTPHKITTIRKLYWCRGFAWTRWVMVWTWSSRIYFRHWIKLYISFRCRTWRSWGQRYIWIQNLSLDKSIGNFHPSRYLTCVHIPPVCIHRTFGSISKEII